MILRPVSTWYSILTGHTEMPRPRQVLDGIRVLDLTHVIAGPYATYQMAVLGADVIKIEDPNTPDMARHMGRGAERNMGTIFRAQGRGKRAIALDLKTQAGKAALLDLIATADVLVENFRVGALAELGLGYIDLTDAYPRLIYCSMTGFGQDGAKADQTAYDNVIQATSGLMGFNGTAANWPLKIDVPVIDYATGLTGAYAVMTALYDRERTGRGQHVDVAMLDTALTLMGPQILGLSEAGGHVGRPAPVASGFAGLARYQTKEGTLMLGALNTRQILRLIEALDGFGWNRPAVLYGLDEARDALEQIFLTRTAQEWEDDLNRAGIPAQRVRLLHETLAEPHVQGRGQLQRLGTAPGAVPVAGFKLSDAYLGVSQDAPEIGADTQEILGKLSYEHLPAARVP